MRDSWYCVGPLASERAIFYSPEWAGGSSGRIRIVAKGNGAFLDWMVVVVIILVVLVVVVLVVVLVVSGCALERCMSTQLMFHACICTVQTNFKKQTTVVDPEKCGTVVNLSILPTPSREKLL